MKYLIIGLGNPGPDYFYTRHNIGFEVLDELAKTKNATFEPARLADKAEIKHRGRTLILLKPTTYMNLSGKAVNYWMQQEKVPVSRIIVITDDLALPFGAIRIKGKGSDGGHNGLKNIQQILNTPNYPRLRFGIGNDFHKGQQVDFVLAKWSGQEQAKLPERIKKSSEAILSFVGIGLERTMNQYNGK